MSRTRKAIKASREKKFSQLVFDENPSEIAKNLAKRRKVTEHTRTLGASDIDEDLEMLRQWEECSDECEEGSAIPIITEKGKWKALKREEDDKDTEEITVPGEAASEEKQESNSETVKKSLKEIKKEIATIAMAVVEQPEGNMSKLRTVLEYAGSKKYELDVTKVSLLSLAAIFKDIIPGYYIRPVTESEQKQTVSKDVKKVRDHEQALLNHYSRYVNILKDIVRRNLRNQGKMTSNKLSLLRVTLSCVQEMVLFGYHFNLFGDLLLLLGQALSFSHEELVSECCSALRRLFEQDEQGEATMMGVRMLSNLIKEQNYNCPAIWLTSLETVRIKAERGGSVRRQIKDLFKRPKKHMSNKQRKEWKGKQEQLAKLAESEAVTSQEQLDKWNSQTLQHLFRIYFGILKYQSNREDLLTPILGGLARHSHRIGVEYFTDLLQSLRKLMTPSLPILPSLHCIITVDRIYAINENLGAMDLKFFYNSLFLQLRRIMQSSKDDLNWEQIREPLDTCFNNLFHPKRIIPVPRLAAFAQRTADVANSFIQKGSDHLEAAFILLTHLFTLLRSNERVQGVLDREPFGQAAYLSNYDDPDLCNPFSRSLYDVLSTMKGTVSSLDRNHRITALIKDILKLAPLP